MTGSSPTDDVAETRSFEADVAQLLHLMVHSIYSERDIFVRELVSNAADACEKLRYELVQNSAITNEDLQLRIRIVVNKKMNEISFEDNGVGMSRAELIQSLGTIASSGTKAFIDKASRPPRADNEMEGGGREKTGDLIGQFGIGFYSAFMVADRVDVLSRRAGSGEAWIWSSEGKSAYSIEALSLQQAPLRGTRVVLHLSEGARDYADPQRIESIVREHSGAVAFPISLEEAPDGQERQLTEGAALWTREKASISKDEYSEFYRGISGQFDEPALTAHWRVEGRLEYTALAFVPTARPLDLFDPNRKSRGRLYVRRVLIARDCEILPGWLRFVRVVVDSSDLPLNVSRELIQNTPVFEAIKRGVTNRVLQELTNASETEAWRGIWECFGPVLKEALYEDPSRRDQIHKIARFKSSTHHEGGRSLSDYVKEMRPNQTSIYFILGDDVSRLPMSPQLEGYRSRGIEVLLLTDPIDAFWTAAATGYDGRPFKSISRGDSDIRSIPLLDGETEKDTALTPQLATLFAFMKQALESEVSEVRASDRLAASAACLVAPEGGADRRLERMLAEHGQALSAARPVMEVNPSHPLIVALAASLESSAARERAADATWLLYDQARLLESDRVVNLASFSERLIRALKYALAGAGDERT